MSAVPRFSVFTPSHKPEFLDECCASLQAQTAPDWEWIVLLNSGASWAPSTPDPRVRILTVDRVAGIGDAKSRACAAAVGTYLVELDHDDVLLPTALERVGEAFEDDPRASLVYSHCAQILGDGSRDDSRFSADAGWVYRELDLDDGRRVQYPVSLAPTPHNVSYIWYAPNHVRAFRRSLYEAIGGYDPGRFVLDDQEIMSRLYAVGPFQLIDECLYLQRMHDANTQRDPATNARIQQETVALYDTTFESHSLSWARRSGLLALDLGAAHNKADGYLGVDQFAGPGVDIVATLPEPLDVPDNSVGVVRAVDFLEHVADKIGLINEIYRILAPGGILISRTPSTDGRGAFQDPTHVAYYNEHSFWYYTEASYRAFVPQVTARFQASRLVTAFPSPWHEANSIPYVYANLIAIKDDTPRNGGALH